VLAINLRYVSHAVPLTLALIAATHLIVARKGARAEWLRQTSMAATGAFAMLLLTQWNYGIRNMELWQQGRLQGKALLLFAKVLPKTTALGLVSGDGDYTVRMALEMERLGIMHPSLLQDLSLNYFRLSNKDLPPERAEFLDFKITPDGQMNVMGYAELATSRPADLVLFTTKADNEPEKIFAFGMLEGVPRYTYYATKRDHEYEANPLLTPERTARWASSLSVLAQPSKDAVIHAWALDVDNMRVHRIPDCRTAQTQHSASL
jgi:hypothetical protein